MFYESLMNRNGLETYQIENPPQQNNHQVLVTNHFKFDSAFESFVVYELHVKIDDASYEIQRRFCDFDWLMIYLNNKYRHNVLPPLPEKRYISGTSKFDRKYIDSRMKSLEKMMNRLCAQECIKDERVKIFLTSETDKFNRYKKAHPNQSSAANFSTNFRFLFSETFVTFKLSKNSFNPSDTSTLKCFESLHHRLSDRIYLKHILDNIDKTQKCWSKFQKISLTLAQELADIILQINESVPNQPFNYCKELAPVIDKAAQIYFNWSSDSKSHVIMTYEKLIPIFREYLAYDEILIKKFRQTISIRRALLVKSNERMQVDASISDSQRDSLPKGNRLDQLSNETETLKDEIEHFDTVFYPSYASWQQNRVKDISEALNVYTFNQISFHRSCLQMCKDFYQKINV